MKSIIETFIAIAAMQAINRRTVCGKTADAAYMVFEKWSADARAEVGK